MSGANTQALSLLDYTINAALPAGTYTFVLISTLPGADFNWKQAGVAKDWHVMRLYRSKRHDP